MIKNKLTTVKESCKHVNKNFCTGPFRPGGGVKYPHRVHDFANSRTSDFKICPRTPLMLSTTTTI